MIVKKKQMKKEQERLKLDRNQKSFDIHNKSDIKTVGYIVGGVILFIFLIYVGINIFNGNWQLFTRKNTIDSSIDSTLVICGTMLNKTESSYMVIAYDFDDEEETIYAAISSKYGESNTIYYLDLSDGLNKSCISEEASKINLNNIKFSGPTLIQVTDGKAIKAYTTKDTIISALNK